MLFIFTQHLKASDNYLFIFIFLGLHSSFDVFFGTQIWVQGLPFALQITICEKKFKDLNG
jgi:hypothetical protein